AREARRFRAPRRAHGLWAAGGPAARARRGLRRAHDEADPDSGARADARRRARGICLKLVRLLLGKRQEGPSMATKIKKESGASVGTIDVTPDANRDPITGEPGSHPVGTAVGGAGGAATGAAVGGALGGPVGAV